MASPPPQLMEELEEEVLLRFPPQEPALLVRASLVCKRWRRLVSAPAFRRRFRELHRTPPMLGFFCSISDSESEERFTSCFVPAAATAALCAPDASLRHRIVIDARHGRVLLKYRGYRRGSGDMDTLVVWDPIADEKLALPFPDHHVWSWTAAVTCAARVTCDHLDCNRGPFLVVFLAYRAGVSSICTYSSGVGRWSDPIPIEHPLDIYHFKPSVLVGNALYFGFLSETLEYDLESHTTSVIGLPVPDATGKSWHHFVLDGGLGFAVKHLNKLCIWRKAGSGSSWAQHRAIELDTLLPCPAGLMVGLVDGAGVLFLMEELALFMIELKTKKVKKVCEGKFIYSVIPYMSFYTPGTGAACTIEGPSVGDSSA